jgi:hypothetical protein
LLNPLSVCCLFIYWRGVDGRLNRHGELLLSLDFLERYDEVKVGRPYRVTYMYVVRYLFSVLYRQLEGFTRALHRLIPRIPSVD